MAHFGQALMNRIDRLRAGGLKALMMAGLLAIATPGRAERPMAVDDAGTLDKGGAKVEFGWSRDDRQRGFDGAIGYAPIENVELELNLARARDTGFDPDVRLRGVGAALKWVPLQAETGLSAGIKLEYARVRADLDGDGRETARGRAVTGLASWAFASGQVAHVNLGREWVRADDETEAANTWGTGFEQPLTRALTLTAEIFGAEDAQPDKQIGLRYEIAEGLKISGAVGHGSDRGFANAGIAWEFCVLRRAAHERCSGRGGQAGNCRAFGRSLRNDAFRERA
jgi:hypothetical protein